MSGHLLECNGIGKLFSGVRVLEDVSYTLDKGEILGLVGENGAGKSTLMNILCGLIPGNEGTMTLYGREYRPQDPSAASQAEIAFIQQELNLFTNLSVAENIYIDNLPRKGIFHRVDFRRITRDAEVHISRLDPRIKPGDVVEQLSMGRRQLVEIAKALAKNAKIIIFDEPTSSLSHKEKDNLFRIIKELRAEGVAVIYISHILEDVFELCDRVLVLRDGKLVGSGDIRNLTKDDMVRLMVGREIKEFYPYRPRDLGGPLLEVKGLSSGKRLHDVSFTVHESEILGFFGVVGAGRTELAQAVFGLDAVNSGSIFLSGTEVTYMSPRERVKRGMAFITENRKEEGLLLSKSVSENLVLINLEDMLKRFRVVDTTASDRLTTESVRRMGIKTYDKNRQLARNLSGGNQQKVVIGKWLLKKPKLFILDEPTRGVDVGAKYDIYNIISELAAQKTGVIMISSEMEELMGVCDRILIMLGGRITGEVRREEFDQKRIIQAAVGGGS